jgi:hypothetical protein
MVDVTNTAMEIQWNKRKMSAAYRVYSILSGFNFGFLWVFMNLIEGWQYLSIGYNFQL